MEIFVTYCIASFQKATPAWEYSYTKYVLHVESGTNVHIFFNTHTSKNSPFNILTISKSHLKNRERIEVRPNFLVFSRCILKYMKTLESCIFLVFLNHNTCSIMSTNKDIAANALVDFANFTAESTSHSQTNSEKPLRWSENSSVYPDTQVIIKALQDPGKNGKGKINKVKHSRIETLAKTLLENINREYPNSLIDKNAHRGKIPIVTCILQFRKQTVLSECMPVHHRHHVDGILHTIDGNDNVTGGLRKVLENYQNFTEDKQKKITVLRTPDDGMR